MTLTDNPAQGFETTKNGICWQPMLPGLDEAIEELEESEKKRRLQIKRVIEALLFASSEPISFPKLREVVDTIAPLPPRVLRALLLELQNEYSSQERSFRLEEIAQGFILRTCQEFSPYIELLHRNKRGEKLSHASAEVLAIIAYKQPITRSQIEAIRGVDSSGSITTLIERQLIHAVGRLEAPGRPTQFGITRDFLRHFGLRDIKELPSVEA